MLYLNDLKRVGVTYVCETVVSIKKNKSVVYGILLLGDKKIPALANIYNNGKLTRICKIEGNTCQERAANKKFILGYMKHCKKYNVNHLHEQIMSRRILKLLNKLAIILSSYVSGYCIYSFIFYNYAFKYIICMFISMVCMFAAILYPGKEERL